MFGIGLNEMLVVGIIALVIIGPKRLPAVARTMGNMMAQFRRATNDLRDAVNDEISSTDLKDIKEAKSALEDDIWNFKNTAQKYIEEGAADIEKAADTAVDPGVLASPDSDLQYPSGIAYGGALPTKDQEAGAEEIDADSTAANESQPDQVAAADSSSADSGTADAGGTDSEPHDGTEATASTEDDKSKADPPG